MAQDHIFVACVICFYLTCLRCLASVVLLCIYANKGYGVILTKPRKVILNETRNSQNLSDELNLLYSVDSQTKAVSFVPVIQQIHSYGNPSINRAEFFFRPKGKCPESFYQQLSDEECSFITKHQLKWLTRFIELKIQSKSILVDELFVNVDPVALSSVVAEIIVLRDVLADRNVSLVIEITERKPDAINSELVIELFNYGVLFALDDFSFEQDIRKALLKTECIRYIKADVNSVKGLGDFSDSLSEYSDHRFIIEKVESVDDVDICLQIKCEAIQGFYLSHSVTIDSMYIN
ncbi:EAL domain-containing protein [Photobacterium swingsii]|uniref:hypothetical protein n=1 Tax=Photobacterium swingsii TaxID=680026 RepID=UPI003D0A43B6